MFHDRKITGMTLKNAILLITYTVVLILCAINYQKIFTFIASFFSLIKPFIYGFGMAYVFHLPMNYFEKKLPASFQKGRTIVSAICSLLLVVIIFTFIFNIVVPQVVDSIVSLGNALPSYLEEAQQAATFWMEKLDISDEVMTQIASYSEQIQTTLVNVVSDVIPALISAGKGITTSVANIVMAFVIAVYLLISKDKLHGQVKRMMYAFLNDNLNAYVTHVGVIANKIFANFISGQMVEAVIIGVLCYIGCLVLKIPYAPIVAVVIGCTNIIPIFGPIIGTGICGFLILFVSPIQAVVFVIFGICLQQFESNLIYPRVVGSSVGLSGLWVLFAITVGGGLFGLMGMVLGLPSFAVAYALLREEMNRRVQIKEAKKALLAKEQSVEIEEAGQ